MPLTFNVPINNVSFGQVSVNILKYLHSIGRDDINIFPIGNVSLNSYESNKEFNDWIVKSINEAAKKYSKNDKCFKLWHLNDSVASIGKEQLLLTFYELDAPTREEINIAKNNHTAVTNKFTQQVFSDFGAKCDYIPLFFDNDTFFDKGRTYYKDGRIVFNLVGKFEHRKHHKKTIQAWVKKYGNNRKYMLKCAIYNVFHNQDENAKMFLESIEGKTYFNVEYIPYMNSNSDYNDFLNAASIVIGMSGGEGWGLPEFQSVCLGKHSVIMNAHGYKEWADSENSVLVNPSGKISAVDGKFFKQNGRYNQGNIFDFNVDDFIDGCEAAIKRVESSPENLAGKSLAKKFTVENTSNSIIEKLEKI